MGGSVGRRRGGGGAARVHTGGRLPVCDRPRPGFGRVPARSAGLLATANFFGDNVSVFSVSPGGALVPVAGSPFRAGRCPFSVAFSPSGGLLATANAADDTVSVFSVSPGGALTPVAGSPFATGDTP